VDTLAALMADIGSAIGRTSVSNDTETVLRNIRGLVPVIQTVHIASVAVVMASMTFINLRVLGLAVPSQNLSEMIRRLMPWTWWALPTLFLSGGVFLLALPNRYFDNPVLGFKMVMLLTAVTLALVFYGLSRREEGYWEASPGRQLGAKVIAGASLLIWVTIVLAGRWIAYSFYLFE
jgi:hypothetical protein